MKTVSLVALGMILGGIPGSWGTAWAGPSATAGPTCDLVEAGYVEVDGLLEDWRGIAGHAVEARAGDSRLTLRCAYDTRRLYLAVAVRDTEVRRAKDKRGEDRLAVHLSMGDGAKATLEAWPGVDGVAPRRTWKGRALDGRGRPAVEVEDSRQQRGWALELAMPMSELAGLSMKVPGVRAEVVYRDADSGGSSSARFAGELRFRAAVEAYKGLLQAARLGRGDVRLDVTGEFDDGPGVERVVAGGTVLGVVSDRYAYISLPVANGRDVRRVEAVDLRGDGTLSIVTELRQFGNGGSRDLLVVWGLGGDGRFARTLAVEVRKEQGGRVMSNRWSLVPRSDARGKAKAGQDLVIEVGPEDVKGWTQATYLETPASDARSILTPWSDETSMRYGFEGTAVVVREGEPAPRRRARGRRKK
ncbi:hypothetical protein [Haliangium sp.]|uniref:hypothetical protein n=1 Tax=Haliangium sp. TaxID=2663208 RepID=UPI003D12FA37